jgi:hypothetical protein
MKSRQGVILCWLSSHPFCLSTFVVGEPWATKRRHFSLRIAWVYDPRHTDLAEEIRRFRELPVQRPPVVQTSKEKSESAKDAQIARLKERVHKLEQQVRELQQENALLYGKLAQR